MVAYLDDLLLKWADRKNQTTPTTPTTLPHTNHMQLANFHNFHPILMKLDMEVPSGGICIK